MTDMNGSASVENGDKHENLLKALETDSEKKERITSLRLVWHLRYLERSLITSIFILQNNLFYNVSDKPWLFYRSHWNLALFG